MKDGPTMNSSTDQFRAARDLLLDLRTEYDEACRQSIWPRPVEFNFALDWFDAVLAKDNVDGVALRTIEDSGADFSHSFAQPSSRSDQLAFWLRARGVTRAMRVLVLLGKQVELWETTLALMKLGAVLIPATTLLTLADLRDRTERAHAGAVIACSDVASRFDHASSTAVRVAVGEPVEGWLEYGEYHDDVEPFVVDGLTKADDPLLVNFTSGTTAMPKLVEHTHSSYPIGHLCTMYWIGLQPVTYTSMCRAPVGRSTPGRVFSPPGLPVPRCAFSTTYVSSPQECWTSCATRG